MNKEEAARAAIPGAHEQDRPQPGSWHLSQAKLSRIFLAKACCQSQQETLTQPEDSNICLALPFLFKQGIASGMEAAATARK